MFSTLQARLWLTYVLVVGAVLAIVAIGLILFLIRNPLADRQTYLRLESIAEVILRQAEVLDNLQHSPTDTLSRIDNVTDIRLLLLSPSYTILADSRSGSASEFEPDSLKVVSRKRGVVRDQEGQIWIFVARLLPDNDWLVLTIPRRGGWLFFLAQRPREILRDDLLPPLIQAAGVALVLALVLAYWVAHWIAAPLQRIAAASRQIARGRFSAIPLEGPDEVKELAQSFNEMTLQVQASQQSQRDFIANVSHELKTPLTSIQGFAQAILDGAVSTPEALHQAANIIFTEAERMNRLVLDLLELARFDAGMIALECAPVNLPDLIQNVVQRLEPQSRYSKVDVIVTLEDGLPVLMGDADRLAQVFSNLIDNALKYSPQGSQVQIQAHSINGQVEVSISDRGPGIPADELPRIFERFYQVDRSRRGGGRHGSGLGLAIVREIVQAHGGHIKAYNSPTGGSVFVVRLPVKGQSARGVKSRGRE